jgi:transaldolase
MEIWLDTLDLKCIKDAKELGILHGVTTNPTLLAKAGQPLEKTLKALLDIQPGPVAVQVTANEAKAMVEQGKALFDYSERIIVKVPATHAGFQAIYILSHSEIPTMATTVFDPVQAFLAAKAKAYYIAPYIGRIEESGKDYKEALEDMLFILERYDFDVKLLGASIHSPEQVRECLIIGMDGVTLSSEMYAECAKDHPQATKSLERFDLDWKSMKPSKLLS